MNTQRFNLSMFNKIREEGDIPGNFTSVRGEYEIPSSTTAFYKANGCMVDALNDEDLRELLSSKILSMVEIPHAAIVPVYDEEFNNNGCLSLNILKQNEEFIDIPLDFSRNYKPINSINDFIYNDIEQISQIPGITKLDLENRKQFLIKYLFASAIISNTDIKMDNMQMIFNKETGDFRNPEIYDMGIAFLANDNRMFFNKMTAEDLLTQLYEEYPMQILPLGQKVLENITEEKIEDVLRDEIYEGFTQETKSDIANQLKQRVNLIEMYNKQILTKGKIDRTEKLSSNSSNAKSTDLIKENRISRLFNRIRAIFIKPKINKKSEEILNNNVNGEENNYTSWDLSDEKRRTIQRGALKIAEENKRQTETNVCNLKDRTDNIK